jgi:hypothetical protein
MSVNVLPKEAQCAQGNIFAKVLYLKNSLYNRHLALEANIESIR